MRITRFIRNPRVSVEEIVRTAAARTAGLVGGKHVLAVQDTTTLRDDGVRHSVNLHPLIALDAESGAMLGLVGATVLERDGTGARAPLRLRPHAQKQSRRWVDMTHEAAKLIDAGAASVTVVSDREADFFESFALCAPGVHQLVRAEYDRCLREGGKLYARLTAEPEWGRVSFDLPARPGRRARRATFALRACPVDLRRPPRCPADRAALPESVVVTAVEAVEIDPPAGVEPAHWRLLTTHAVESLADAERIVGFYRDRWVIEQVFRTMKTKGFDVEALRVADTQPFSILCVAALVAAILVMQMVRERDGLAGRPLEDGFDAADRPLLRAVCASVEGKTLRQKNPHDPGSLAYASWICARLGGWNGYYGKPGPIVIYNGLLQLRAIMRGWSLRQLV
jgi:hypothetical protein